jgi:Nucleotidyl transferase AbiEii toxin, Type IV TA system
MAEGKRGDAGAVFEQAVVALRETGAEFMLVGATAYGMLTLPRATYDLDFLVGDDPTALARIRRAFLVDEETHDVFFDQRALLLEVPGTVTPVELFIATHWFTRQALARRRLAPSGTPAGEVPTATPEDLLLLKATVASHPARASFKRATDLADLGLLIDAKPDLDLRYLRENAARLGVVALLLECGLDL